MCLPGFHDAKILGQGSYGCVYKAVRETDGQTYAVKVIDMQKLNREEIEDSVNEIRLMASFNSPFILRFYEAFCNDKKLCIVTEYARLGDLAHLIERKKRKCRPLLEEDIWRYLIQILEALRILHSAGVVHRDLKSANILISAPDLVKVGDLGVSTVLHTKQLARTQIGTPLYLAPEIWKNRPYDSKCDMWSLGVLLYEMMTYRFPFIGRNTKELAQKVCIGRYTSVRGYSNDLISIMRRLLVVNPVTRATVHDILNLQCVKARMHLVSLAVDSAAFENQTDKLLSTIKVPRVLSDLHLPPTDYDSRNDHLVKPIQERVHIKGGVLKRDISLISSPELQLITDYDLWSPVRKSVPNENTNNNKYEPKSARPSAILPIVMPKKPVNKPPVRRLPLVFGGPPKIACPRKQYH